MMAFITISAYFILNLLVTITNRRIITDTACPYLLTALHAAASYVSTSVLSRLQSSPPSRNHGSRLNAKVLLFSLLFSFNITLSNYTLGMVSLPVHQTIRAVAPALTIIFSVYLGLRTWSSYGNHTYLSLVPVVLGVIITAHSGRYEASFVGLILTLLGAATATLKTIATHALQTQLGITSTELIRHTAPLAMVWSLTLAYHYEEFNNIDYLPRLKVLARGEPWTWQAQASLVGLMVGNAILAAGLNLASFEANRRCGPVSMGVAANLKQVAILFMPFFTRGKQPRSSVLIGGLMTIAGGMWYAMTQTTSAAKGEREAEHASVHELRKLESQRFSRAEIRSD